MLLSAGEINNFQILNIIGFPALVILPGFLTLKVFRVEKLDFWGFLGLSAGLSLFELMLVGLLGNTFLPFFGVTSPLSKSTLLVELSYPIIALILILWFRSEEIKLKVRKYLIFDQLRDFILAFAPIIFVVMSIFGAIRLNNGGDGIITLVMLIGIAGYSAVLVYYSKKVGDDNVIPVALFFIALALLLMTSLRGWYITGHDVQREYRVFELTKNNDIWSIQTFRDAYNACMSITVLPTIFYRLLKFSDQFVYKFFFQVIFAIVPGIIFITIKRYANSWLAFLSVLYFIAFPTFFQDMPMLNRQEIAFVFLSLMAYAIFEQKLKLNARRILMTILGLGMVLSHYSTTYTFIAIILFLLIARPMFLWLSRRLKKRRIFSDSSLALVYGSSTKLAKQVTVWMVVILMLASFLWSSVLTDTSNNSISRVILETIKVMQKNTKEDAKSGDVLYSLFSWKKLDPDATLREYNEKVILPERLASEGDIYYSDAAYEKYPIRSMDDEIMPLTQVGKTFADMGLDVPAFNYAVRQGSAKLLQVLVLIGFGFVLFRKKFIRKVLDVDFVMLAGGSLVLVLSQIVLPVLSVEYGILRAFQQGLFFLGIFVVVGSLVLVSKFKHVVQVSFASFLAIVFFLSSTGVFTQILGGYGAQLHLNNEGAYYDMYYLHEAEIAGINWFSNNIKIDSEESEFQSELQSDRYVSFKSETILNKIALNDIYPALVKKSSYVFLGFTNTNKKSATIFYNGNNITYGYPVQFLDDNKNLIYSNGGALIYR